MRRRSCSETRTETIRWLTWSETKSGDDEKMSCFEVGEKKTRLTCGETVTRGWEGSVPRFI